jgi:quinol monooxygenase YgiN
MYAKFIARPGERAALVSELLVAARLVDGAPGVLVWLVNESMSDPDAVWITEVWASKADHDASLSLPGVHEQIARTMPLLAAPPEQVTLAPVGGLPRLDHHHHDETPPD